MMRFCNVDLSSCQTRMSEATRGSPLVELFAGADFHPEKFSFFGGLWGLTDGRLMKTKSRRLQGSNLMS